MHETSISKIGTVPCNKASHLLAQAKHKPCPDLVVEFIGKRQLTQAQPKPSPSQAQPVYEDRCAKHRYQSGTVPRNKASQTGNQPSPSDLPSRSQVLFINTYAKKVVLLEDKVGPCSISSTSFLILSATNDMVWCCILFE